jgi:ectoine hydroxylase-related dioxygenase (phytanoyl-CoA dioxygenase family)
MSEELQVSTFLDEGFIIAEDILPIDSVRTAYNISLANFAEITSLIETNKLHFGIGIKNGFKEIVQRHQSRYEMPYKVETLFFDEILRSSSRINDLVAKILNCSNYEIINKSMVISLPGCSSQAWHSDGPHLDFEHHLRCHCLNVFIPLIDMDLSLGPTEIRPRSHYYSRDLAKLYLLAHLKKEVKIEANVVPEPTSALLLLLSGSTFCFQRRRAARA